MVDSRGTRRDPELSAVYGQTAPDIYKLHSQPIRKQVVEVVLTSTRELRSKMRSLLLQTRLHSSEQGSTSHSLRVHNQYRVLATG
jgi:hypothetical protein